MENNKENNGMTNASNASGTASGRTQTNFLIQEISVYNNNKQPNEYL